MRHPLVLGLSFFLSIASVSPVISAQTPPSTGEAGSVYVTAGTTRAQVLLDGREVGTTPVRIDNVSPGQHVVEIRHEGRAGSPHPITVRSGRLFTLSLTPGTDGGPPRPAPPSLTEVLARHEDNCDHGDGRACVEAATIRLRGGRGVPRDASLAAQLLRRGCNAGNAGACTQLGGLYNAGQGVTQNAATAAQHHRDACTNGSMPGCVSYGRMLEQGQGVTRDLPRALELYRRACEAGNPQGCEGQRRLSR